MPPSPWLSARITTDTYLTAMTITSAQKIKDSTPSTVVSLTGSPCSSVKVSRSA